MSESSGKNGSLGFVGALTIVFIILKLCHVIAWSWGWVLSPCWITALTWVVIVGFLIFLKLLEYRK